MYREIVTKAVVGKGRIFNNNEAIVSPINKPSKVLGCWIINHYCICSYENNNAVAKGKYDLHIWYGFDSDKDTTIHKQTVDYIENFTLKMKNDEVLNEENELIIKCLKYPTCTSLNLKDDGTIGVNIEKELILDVIGEATLKVQVGITGDEEWVNAEDIESIDVNYLNK